MSYLTRTREGGGRSDTDTTDCRIYSFIAFAINLPNKYIASRRILFFALIVLMGCSTQLKTPIEDGPGDRLIGDQTPDAVPRFEPKSRYGNPRFYDVWGKRYYVLNSSTGYLERGIASWYGSKFHGRRTSSGEPYDMYAMTAAHKSLPLPTYVEVTNLENSRRAILRVNDRGPFHGNRLIDLSYAAAMKLGIAQKGTGLVEVRALEPIQPKREKVMASASTLLTDPRIYIQVGAFTSRQNAELLRNQLKVHNLGDILIQPDSHQQKTVFKVRIGPLVSVDLADSTAQRLNQLGMQDYRVVID